MTQVEGDRGDLARAVMQLFFAERAAPAVQIFAGEFQSVKHSANYARHIRQCAAQPRLWKCFVWHSGFSPVRA